MELIVVMSVTVLLTGLLLPSLVHVRENAHRVICASNLRQVGLATVLYADDREGALPPSWYGKPGRPKQEMMAAYRGKGFGQWEGFGYLHRDLYCNAPEIFYCPSHHGAHFYERYHKYWRLNNTHKIYTNYHYAGPVDWVTGAKRRLSSGRGIILAIDGMRTVRDFNHTVGTNVLWGDNSVVWRDDVSRELVSRIPATASEEEDDGGNETDEPLDDDDDLYTKIWDIIKSHG